MLNFIWAGMILTGILWGMLHGQLLAVTEAALNGAREAVSLSITMLGVMSLWTGVLEIGTRAGIIDSFSKKLRPVLSFLFPNLPGDSEAVRQISINMIANMLGLGWAATPAGLKAMEELKKLEEEKAEGGTLAQKKGTASREMCTFLILNISSLQLVPITMIAYRSQYGSQNPVAIAGPCLAATFLSTAAAVIFCKIMDRKGS